MFYFPLCSFCRFPQGRILPLLMVLSFFSFPSEAIQVFPTLSGWPGNCPKLCSRAATKDVIGPFRAPPAFACFALTPFMKFQLSAAFSLYARLSQLSLY